MDVYVKGKKIRLKPSKSIGKGGEADVYNIGSGKALKLFKQPEHPDYQHSPAEQQAARDRIDEHQFKLRLFPSDLPSRVIHPQDLVTDPRGQMILGYTMQLLPDAEVLTKYSDRSFRQAGISQQAVVEIFCDLHDTLSGIHQGGAIVGDFNDLNVLVRGREAYIIDADSFQLPTFPCRVFTARFVDPLLCDSTNPKPVLSESYSADSDWYAFTVMFMQCLLFVHPYGGVYRPKDPTKRIPHEARPLQGITIFHQEVKYPKPAIPYQVLPEDLLHYFHEVFEMDIRGKFPRDLLENLYWTKCLSCGLEHARPTCPDCAIASPAARPKASAVRGTVTATKIFTTEGTILFATLEAGELRFIYHHGGEFKREDNAAILSGSLDPHLQLRVQGNSTLIGKDGQLITLTPGKAPSRLAVETGACKFDANQFGRYWIDGGQLLRDGELGSEYIGDVLANQTQFWVGPNFGFGFYRAGNLNVAFVFDARRRGINDRVKLPPWSGQLLEANCALTSDRCWFFWTTQERGLTMRRCAIIRADGSLEAEALAQRGDGSWLGGAGRYGMGHCAAGHFLLAATDDGILRVEPQNGKIVKTKEFPDTEPFVDASSQLFPGPQGLYVVNQHDIQLLQIA